MSSVDDRIVNMSFNNKQFESGAAQSMKTLDAVESKIAKAGQGKGLNQMADGVTQVSSRFSALQVAGVTAIATITNKAVNAGINIVKSLSVNPLKQGFSEYQTNLNSVQTIISNTGEDLNTVTKYLNKLNTYSDKTIYNFSEMARNIGTFTAAGVKLDTATASIKGIANLAALSGSNSQQASTAMYQLSQAIAAGRVGLQDWNSVVNAGMGGKIFQEALARTASNMGNLTEGAVKLDKVTGQLTVNGESFRQSISTVGGTTSWLSGSVLTETLSQISGGFDEAKLKSEGYTEQQIKDIKDLSERAFEAATNIKTLPQLFQVVQESIGSMWAKTFSLILGDFNQSKELWGNVGSVLVGPSGVITKLSNGVNGMLKDWADAGGRDDLLRGFERAFKNIWRIIVPFKNAFRDIFPPASVNTLTKITENFKNFAEFLKPSVKTMHSLRSIFGGVFAVLHIGIEVVKAIASGFGALFGALAKNSGGSRDGILGIAASIGDVLIALDKWITSGGKLSDAMTAVGDTLGAILQPILAFVGLIGDAIGNLASGQGIEGFLAPFEGASAIFKSFLSAILGGLAKITAPFDKLSNFFSNLQDKIGATSETFEKFTAPLSSIGGKFEATVSRGIVTPLNKVESAAKSTGDKVSKSFDKVTDATDKTKDAVSEVFEVFHGPKAAAATSATSSMQSDAKDSASVWESIASVLSGALSQVGDVADGIGTALSFVKDQFSDLFGDLDALEFVGFINAILTGAILLKIAQTFKSLGSWTQIFKKAFVDTVNAVTDTMKAFQQSLKAKAIKDIAIAIGILAAAIFVLSLVDASKLGKALGAVAVLLGEMTATLYALSKIDNKELFVLSTTIVLISGAMLNLAIAISILGQQSWQELGKGIGAMAAALGILVAALFAFSKIKGSIEGMAGAILIISIAMNALAAAVLAFGSMNMKTLEKGLGGMAAALGIVVLALLGLDQMKKSVEGVAGAIFIISAAMVVLSAAVLAFGKMDPEVLGQGLTAMAVALALLVGSIGALAAIGGENVLGAAGAILLLATALNLLVPVIITLGTLPWQVVYGGFLALAVGLGILLAAGAIAGIPIVSAGLAVLSTTMLALGASLLIAGIGMSLFGAGFAVLAATGTAGVAVLVAAFEAFMALLPQLGMQLAAGVVGFLKVLANASPKIRKALGEIIHNLLGVVIDAIPELAAVFGALLEAAIKVIVEYVPKFIEAGFTIIDEFLKSANEHIPSIVDSAFDLITSFLEELGNHVGDLAQAGLDMVVDILDGISDAVENSDRVREAAGNLVRTFVDEVREMLTDLLGSIDIGSMLPSLGGLDLNPLNRTDMSGRGGQGSNLVKTLGTLIKNVGKEVQKVLALTVSEIFSDDPIAQAAQTKANEAQRRADAAANKAQIKEKLAGDAQRAADKADKKAERLRKIAEKKKATKAEKEAAKAAEKHAEHLQKLADKAAHKADTAGTSADRVQSTADRLAQEAIDAKAFAEADTTGKGDIKSDLSVTLANKAQEMLEKANAEAKEAERLAKGNKKERAQAAKLRELAQKHAEQARQWALEAQQAQDAATTFYVQAAQERLQAIKDKAIADAQALKDQQAYDAASTQGKADIMAQRAKDSAAAAAAAQQRYTDALIAAQAAIDAGDADAAQAQLDLAEEAAAEAQQLSDQAYQQSQQAKQLAEQAAQEAASGSSTDTPGGVIQPSRTALEDAAKQVDRYTQSVADAQSQAGAGGTVYNFNQTNTSPVALSASEIYRQSKNLVAGAAGVP